MQMKHAVGQDSETESTEQCPKYNQSTVIQIQLENRPVVKTSKTSSNREETLLTTTTNTVLDGANTMTTEIQFSLGV